MLSPGFIWWRLLPSWKIACYKRQKYSKYEHFTNAFQQLFMRAISFVPRPVKVSMSCSHILPFNFCVFSLGRRPVCHDFSTSTQTVWVQLQPYTLQASEELSFRQASLGAVPIVTLTNGTDKEAMRAEWNPVSICHNALMILLQNQFSVLFHQSGSVFLDGTLGEWKLGKLR